ncbi:MAG: ElyC/SanA/YdcF family protein [Anaerolineaceae bacterium]
MTLAGAILITADPLEKADVVVLLSGGDQARMDEAVRIYEDKFASTIILTETGEGVEGYDVQYSKEQRDLLVDKGIPLGAIRITEKPVGSTRGEAKAVKKIMAAKMTSIRLLW